jgi:hypothetical protein
MQIRTAYENTGMAGKALQSTALGGKGLVIR